MKRPTPVLTPPAPSHSLGPSRRLLKRLAMGSAKTSSVAMRGSTTATGAKESAVACKAKPSNTQHIPTSQMRRRRRSETSRQDNESVAGTSRAARCCSADEMAKPAAPPSANGTASGSIFRVIPSQSRC